jgi:hypothetical protein
MANTYQQLGQARENSTNAVSVYSPGASEEAIIKSIIVANTSGADATVRIFVDDDGTTYDESTAIAWDVTIPADSVWDFETTICMNDATGNLAYRSSVSNALTVTVNGVVKS